MKYNNEGNQTSRTNVKKRFPIELLIDRNDRFGILHSQTENILGLA